MGNIKPRSILYKSSFLVSILMSTSGWEEVAWTFFLEVWFILRIMNIEMKSEK